MGNVESEIFIHILKSHSKMYIWYKLRSYRTDLNIILYLLVISSNFKDEVFSYWNMLFQINNGLLLHPYRTKEVNFSLPALRSTSLGELRDGSVSSLTSDVLCPPTSPQFRSNSFSKFNNIIIHFINYYQLLYY